MYQVHWSGLRAFLSSKLGPRAEDCPRPPSQYQEWPQHTTTPHMVWCVVILVLNNVSKYKAGQDYYLDIVQVVYALITVLRCVLILNIKKYYFHPFIRGVWTLTSSTKLLKVTTPPLDKADLLVDISAPPPCWWFLSPDSHQSPPTSPAQLPACGWTWAPSCQAGQSTP